MLLSVGQYELYRGVVEVLMVLSDTLALRAEVLEVQGEPLALNEEELQCCNTVQFDRLALFAILEPGCVIVKLALAVRIDVIAIIVWELECSDELFVVLVILQLRLGALLLQQLPPFTFRAVFAPAWI